MKRVINTELIYNAVIDLINDSSFELHPAVKELFTEMKSLEASSLAEQTMGVILENSDIAMSEQLPLCQDCGVVTVFLDIGQDVHLEGDFIYDVIERGVENAYSQFNLRKSVVKDPLRRQNTGTNAPAFIHTEIVPGDSLTLTVYLKGGGSENMTALKMFRPTESIEVIIDFIEKTVIEAGPNPCPPIFLGIGIGGTADSALLNSKKAVIRGFENKNPDPFYRGIEERIMERLNSTNVGPLGFGGASTSAGVYIINEATHLATLPVALNLNCHSLRFRTIKL